MQRRHSPRGLYIDVWCTWLSRSEWVCIMLQRHSSKSSAQPREKALPAGNLQPTAGEVLQDTPSHTSKSVLCLTPRKLSSRLQKAGHNFVNQIPGQGTLCKFPPSLPSAPGAEESTVDCASCHEQLAFRARANVPRPSRKKKLQNSYVSLESTLMHCYSEVNHLSTILLR